MATSKRLPLYVAGGAGVSALAVLLGVTVSNSTASGSPVSANPSSTVVKTRDSSLGRILVDAQGRTMYLFEKDTSTSSNCDGSCASFWPPVPASATPQVSGGASAASVTSIARPGGVRQLSYAGHPLYYFVGDNKAGQTKGQNLDQFGAKWYVLDPAGAAVTAAPAASGGGSGGYGY